MDRGKSQAGGRNRSGKDEGGVYHQLSNKNLIAIA